MLFESPGASLGLRLRVITCGMEDCSPGHLYGPAVRGYFLLHVVRKGRGEFENTSGRFTIRPGQGFFIFPGVVTVNASITAPAMTGPRNMPSP